MMVPAPPPVDFLDEELVRQSYYPQLLELAKKHTGSKDAFMMNFLTRSENPESSIISYARFAHTDGGPPCVDGYRRALRFRGVPEEEARTCDICMYGIWHPRDHPAFRDPLCLLDASSMPPGMRADGSPMDSVHYRVGRGSRIWKTLLQEMVGPRGEGAAAFYDELGKQVMYDLGPLFSPGNRWVYCPDQRPDEAWLFKHYDTRPGVAQWTSHSSFHDPFYDSNPGTPGRRSCEFRMLLTFPKKPAAAAATPSKL